MIDRETGNLGGRSTELLRSIWRRWALSKHRWLAAAAAFAAVFVFSTLAGAAPLGAHAEWTDTIFGLTTTQVGVVNGFPQAFANGTGRFDAITPNGITGAEPIFDWTACTSPGATPPCVPASGIRTQAGLDGCTPDCTAVDPSGVKRTGTIDMHWFAARGTGPGSHQQVAILLHGTGGLANLRGVLQHPAGKYVGTIHWDAPCISGHRAGPLTVAAGQSVCVSPGATISGPVSVGTDGELYADDASFDGPLRSDGASTIALCGDTVSGPVTIAHTTGPILIGEPATGDCAGNTIAGPVRLEDNGCATCGGGADSGAIDFSGNTVGGPLRVTGNVGTFILGYFAPNTVSGPVTNSGNS
jgi:hypothetical protein